jgi:hypothetical protein
MDFVGVFLDHSFCKQVFACSSHKCTFKQISGMLFGHIFRKLLMRRLPTTLESAISFDICLKVFFKPNMYYTSSCYTLPRQLPDI